MNSDAVDAAGLRLLGTHDFTSFCAKDTVIENRIRTIFDIHWRRAEEEWIFSIQGSGFLQRMVRTIVGTLLYVGQGRLQPDCIPAILEAKDRNLAGPSVPAHGLHLLRVEY
jgi:tRNA pseudouridine38-40 synthase